MAESFPNAQIVHRKFTGDRADGWDRPLELESLEQAADEIERLQEELAASNGAIDRLAELGGPKTRSQLIRHVPPRDSKPPNSCITPACGTRTKSTP